ncbi:MAG: hypothetical protein A2057_04660 [Ignavibacteria bacterium GWA2_35_9]|nr:MAG: hypothetical protein A2057_04660 [Ignavibacteria bacterium GWA2_35_9]OGU45602.1 MAG: hypothetical protein A2000_12975 [Ignavibacteria bacterium GWB2_36_8]OGU49259.1 MAG: hypothetical protein A2080_10240 [Ignavibacteria bacterium GWC2_36_12]
MSVVKPYRRICRQFADGTYGTRGRWEYMLHKKYAKSPEHYIRAFLLIQKDLLTLFDYIEPADKNSKTYSYRIHELLLRTCVEVEANCKAILIENGYRKKSDNMCMNDYKKIEISHKLSSYKIKLPIWNGKKNVRDPFSEWKSKGTLQWYDIYNQTKHDRHSKFKLATFDNLIDAICGLISLISSQFWRCDFPPTEWILSLGGINDGMESAIGEYFRVKFPTDWDVSERYEFDWNQLKNDTDPFQNSNY